MSSFERCSLLKICAILIPSLYIKPYVKDIPVLYYIILSLDHQFPCIPACMFRSVADKIIVFHHLRPDKSPFQVAVDHPGRLGCRHAPVDRPCPHLLGPGRKECLQVEQVIGCPNKPVHAGFGQSGISEKCNAVVGIIQFGDLRFEPAAMTSTSASSSFTDSRNRCDQTFPTWLKDHRHCRHKAPVCRKGGKDLQ